MEKNKKNVNSTNLLDSSFEHDSEGAMSNEILLAVLIISNRFHDNCVFGGDVERRACKLLFWILLLQISTILFHQLIFYLMALAKDFEPLLANSAYIYQSLGIITIATPFSFCTIPRNDFMTCKTSYLFVSFFYLFCDISLFRLW